VLLAAACFWGLAQADMARSWAWVAVTGVLAMLAAIAIGARRRLPFGD
jgi:hypothetical protein